MADDVGPLDVGADAASITVSMAVNGEALSVEAHPFAPLSETLRSDLGLTGTKVGCGAGDCGACTVLMDGAQVCACLVSTAQADGAKIETVEHLRSPWLDQLRKAFHARGAAQCGICSPGMLMAAADLLERNDAPSRVDVEDALGGVLCRCTGYRMIVDAVLAAAHPMASPTVAAEAGSAVGTPIPRVDGAPKLDGGERYGADGVPEGALWLRLVRSPHHAARFDLGDLDVWRKKHPGIKAILSAKDIPGRNAFGILPHLKDQPVLADGVVRHRGEPVLALVGDERTVMGANLATLPIVWQPETPILAVGDAKGNARLVQERFADNVLIRGRVVQGDCERGITDAAALAEGCFRTRHVEHAYIEPEAGFAEPLPGGRVAVSASTQAPYMDLEEVAAVLGVDHDRVRIRPSGCGGGFGGKLDVSLQPILAVAAMALNRPVATVYSRPESMAATTKRHPAEITASMAADAKGRLLAFRSDADFDTGAYSSWGPTVAGRVPVHATGPYAVPNVANHSVAWLTNGPPCGAFRGFGVPQAAIAHETLMDDLAEQLGMDRWAIRHLNAIRAGDMTATGQTLNHSAGLADCLDALKGDWRRYSDDAEKANAGNPRIRRGAGIACMWYGCGNTSMSNPSTMRVVLDRDGSLTFFNGAVDIGQGSSTVLLQICADALGLPVEDFSFVTGDTDLTADAGKTSASRQTFVSGNAALLAGTDLREKLLKLANVGPDAKLMLHKGRLVVTEHDAARSIDLSALDGPIEGVGRYDPPTTALDGDGQGTPYATYGFAAQIALVDVDTALGTVKVRAMVAAHDVGRAVNPMLIEGQIHGGIAQGLGLALMEEFVPGRTENLHDYLIPTFGDMPDIQIRLVEDPEHEGPFGAKGIGEPALVPTAPAILGAIRHATGVTMREVPVLPHRLWAALRDAEEDTLQ
ncbi:MAG: molybdopterin cofactor-binding domain-containing protein [Pseudomonadota bacterium]